jgi:hypothetical protein
MGPAMRPLGSLSMARGCARIDSRPDTAKIGSADRVEAHPARLLAVIAVRKTFPHGLDPKRTSCGGDPLPRLSSGIVLDFRFVPMAAEVLSVFEARCPILRLGVS